MKRNCMWRPRKLRFIVCSLALFIVFALVAGQAELVTLNLSGIPDGTPLPANNPYSGVVNLEGQANFQFMEVEPPSPSVSILAENGYIRSGAIWMGVSPLAWPETPPGTETDPGTQRVTATLTATFLQPVTDLTFTTEVPAYSVFYQYEGVDQNGSPFSGDGETSSGSIRSPSRFQGIFAYTMSLEAPEGGHFTELALSNWDYGGGAASFQVYDFAVRTIGVAEPSNWMDRACLVLLVAMAPFVRRIGRSYEQQLRGTG